MSLKQNLKKQISACEERQHSRLGTDHACAWILPDERVPQDLGEFTGSEWRVGLVTAKSPDTFLKHRDRCRWRSYGVTFKITWPGSSQVTPRTFRANRLLLISAPSRRVWRSALEVSAPLSFPARSIRENLPCILSFLRRIIWNTAWLRDEWALADVCPDVLDRTNECGVYFSTRWKQPLNGTLIPAAVPHFDEFQDIFCAPDLLLLEPHNLNLLFPVLQHPQLSFTVQQIEHLKARNTRIKTLPSANEAINDMSLAFPL